jgi:3-oxoacyl-[acyl-carrier protein] reductase
VNVSGTWGSYPKDGYLGYAVCKAGIESLTKSSAIELAPLGIRVNCVSPSTVDTNMYLYMGMTEPKYARFKDESRWKIPLWQKDDSNKLQPRIANVAEIANAIIFLTAEESKKITGHIMKVDGGKSLTTSDFEPKFDKLDKSILPSLLSKPGA